MEQTRQWRVFLFAACTTDEAGFGNDRHCGIGQRNARCAAALPAACDGAAMPWCFS
ncbi:hypothetical protein XMIN_535 [Xanthomonas citri pv. mangiferaeindicae LMG 941]|nr:hypothetical protein XMIN_535 [Xanthomonas citri pv. mangiferaeindicae LMG 941]